jgi:Ohr subfamily peroxiredoxin
MTSTPLYTASATAWGGREGRVATDDERLDVQLSVPKELGGDGGPGTNPEQLLASGFSACFHNALKLVARRAKVDVPDSAVSVSIAMVPADIGFDLSARIVVEAHGVDRAVLERLVDTAHQVCPFSRATRDGMTHEIVILDEQ